MTEPAPLNLRKRQATRDRVATTAAELVAANGLAGTTVERIAAAAEIGRATFFRHFSSKEEAVAEGMTRLWLDEITTALARQPAELSATEAVVEAFGDLGAGFDEITAQIRDLADLSKSSSALSAWTLQTHARYELAIAGLIAPRFAGAAADDPRPRLIGALAMASVRIALDDWVRLGGSLPQRVRSALSSMAIH
jgi:AcrR family transcriptional regulator